MRYILSGGVSGMKFHIFTEQQLNILVRFVSPFTTAD